MSKRGGNRRARVVTRRPTYRDAVAWIAHGDDSGSGAAESDVADYISTTLVADLFGADSDAVARDVVRERRKAGLPVGDDSG